jgi:hypothetical protein
MAALSTRTHNSALQRIFDSFANSLRRSQSWKLLINYAHRNTSSQSEGLSAMRLARSGCDAVGLAIVRSQGSERAEGTSDVAMLNYAYALCTCLAQPSLLGICLATAWQVKPLITSATKRRLRVLVESGFTRIHFPVSGNKSTGQSMPCRS